MQFILGIDEVGRGALAGPVHLAGVALPIHWPLLTYPNHQLSGKPENWSIPGSREYDNLQNWQIIRDSKLLSATKRQTAAQLVDEFQLVHFCLQASNQLIDQYGIGVCLSYLLALGILQVQNLAATNDDGLQVIIVDGQIKLMNIFDPIMIGKLTGENKLSMGAVDVENISLPMHIIKRENQADDKYLSVALASCYAKVTRDQVMSSLDRQYPLFNWSQNKGYGTPRHRRTILQEPTNQFLRLTFLNKLVRQEQ